MQAMPCTSYMTVTFAEVSRIGFHDNLHFDLGEDVSKKSFLTALDGCSYFQPRTYKRHTIRVNTSTVAEA